MRKILLDECDWLIERTLYKTLYTEHCLSIAVVAPQYDEEITVILKWTTRRRKKVVVCVWNENKCAIRMCIDRKYEEETWDDHIYYRTASRAWSWSMTWFCCTKLWNWKQTGFLNGTECEMMAVGDIMRLREERMEMFVRHIWFSIAY